MDFHSYLIYFQNILADPAHLPPYNNPDYLNYTRLNWSRVNRWLKTGTLSDDIKTAAGKITQPQHWIIITEPWCGDAAHIVPFLHKITQLNPLITAEYELRDSVPFRINQYLTNGGKAIPKLVIKDRSGTNLATWGPRPADCQLIYSSLTARKADFETIKHELQKWYNNDRGRETQREIAELLNAL